MIGDTVECPHCGHENDMSDGLTDLPSDNKFDHECDSCEKEFEVHVEFYPSYSGSKIVYERCDGCGKEERDVRKKGRTFPFPEAEHVTVLCNNCYIEAMRKRFYEERAKTSEQS